MPDTIICTDRETWMLSGTDDEERLRESGADLVVASVVDLLGFDELITR